MIRIPFDHQPKESMITSYLYFEKKYLADNNLIEVTIQIQIILLLARESRKRGREGEKKDSLRNSEEGEFYIQ